MTRAGFFKSILGAIGLAAIPKIATKSELIFGSWEYEGVQKIAMVSIQEALKYGELRETVGEKFERLFNSDDNESWNENMEEYLHAVSAAGEHPLAKHHIDQILKENYPTKQHETVRKSFEFGSHYSMKKDAL